MMLKNFEAHKHISSSSIIIVGILIMLIYGIFASPVYAQQSQESKITITEEEWKLVKDLKDAVVSRDYKNRDKYYFAIRKNKNLVKYLKEVKPRYYSLYEMVGVAIDHKR